jgi:TRAP-type C4-dicarboxylate transport system permease small subunit
MALHQITQKLSEVSEKAVCYTLTVMMAVMTITIIIQVFLRYIFSYSLSWSEEVARYLMIWVAFLGGSLALKKGLHLGVELVVSRLHQGVKRWVLLFSQLLIFLFLLSLTIGGTTLTWAVRDQSSPALLFSMSLAYLSAPVGGLFMAIQSFHLLIKEWVKA